MRWLLGRGLQAAACVLAVGTVLGACGQKGPLFIPTAEDLREIEEREQKLEERKRRKSGEPAPAPAQTSPAPDAQTPP